LLLPLTVLYRWLLAFPPFCPCLQRKQPVHLRYTFPSKYGSDFVRERVYESKDNATGVGSFVILADPGGGIWFERFWGLINVLKLEVSDDDQSWHLSGSWLTWLADTTVHIKFAEGTTDVEFDFGYQLQPFSLLTVAFAASSVWRYQKGINEWLEPQDAKLVALSDQNDADSLS